MRFFVPAFLAMSLAVAAAPVCAQGVFDLGVLTGTAPSSDQSQRQQAKGAIPHDIGGILLAPKAAAAKDTAAVSALSFKASPEVRKRNLAKFVERTRAVDAAGATQLEQLFAAQDVIEEVAKALQAYGMRTDNVADAFALYWINAWNTSRGISEETSKEQAKAVQRQVANALLVTPDFTAADDALKQELAEALIIQAVLLEAALQQSAGDTLVVKQLMHAARQGAKGMGLELDQMQLTPDGFVPAKK